MTLYNGMDQSVTYWVHPDVASATVHLIGKAGAKRIRIAVARYQPKVVRTKSWLRFQSSARGFFET